MVFFRRSGPNVCLEWTAAIGIKPQTHISRHQPTLGRHLKVRRIRMRPRSSCSETGSPAEETGASNRDSVSREEEGDCGGLLFLERSWTADERTVPKIKSQEAVRIPRNADPNALPDFAGFVVTASEP